ncbi:MAG: trypsin-like peptidase domain-containing protein [Candidatus Pacebacteria bacterium]|nr:trypsin-like peptidase domain-containing protein [Candidatus Paceibacterota bacterium]
MRSLPEDNLSYPVLIKLEDGSSGSGFFLNDNTASNLYFITAAHVFFKDKILKNKKATLTCYSKDLNIKNPIVIRLDLEKLSEQKVIKKHKIADVVIVKIAKMENIDKSKNVEGVEINLPEGGMLVTIINESIKKYEDVLVSNEVFVLGYPNSLGDEGQIDYERPLLRKGIIAGKNDKTKNIILDCPVYFGNSGGLAIEVEHTGKIINYKAIGIVTQFVPFKDELFSKKYGRVVSVNTENSGYSIIVPMDTILDLLQT